jgi:hypothetical protein
MSLYSATALSFDITDLDITDPNSGIREGLRRADPTPIIPGSKAVSEKAWGEAGAAGYTIAQRWMLANNGKSRSLDKTQKHYLRPHFGDLVDRVRVVYNANMIDEWSAAGFSIKQTRSRGQTFGHRIYLNPSYRKGDSSQLITLAHELVHVKQFERYGSTYGKFGFHYFREYKRAGQNYRNNKLEKEAYNFDCQFTKWLSNNVPNKGQNDYKDSDCQYSYPETYPVVANTSSGYNKSYKKSEKWELATHEGHRGNFKGRMRYGANGKWIYKNFPNSNTYGIIESCNNHTFGGDPIPGVKKSCYRIKGVLNDGPPVLKEEYR